MMMSEEELQKIEEEEYQKKVAEFDNDDDF